MILKYESSISKYFMLYKWCLIEFDTLVLWGVLLLYILYCTNFKCIAWSWSHPSKLPALGGLEITWSHVHPIPHKLFDWLIDCWLVLIQNCFTFLQWRYSRSTCAYMFYTHWLNILMYQHQPPFHGSLTSVTAGPGAAFTWRQASVFSSLKDWSEKSLVHVATPVVLIANY